MRKSGPLTRKQIDPPDLEGDDVRTLEDDDLGTLDSPIERVTLERCTTNGAKSGLRVRDAHMRSCEMRNGSFVDLDAARMALDGCRGLGADVSGMTLRDAMIGGCDLRMVRAFGVRMTRCFLESCDLREAEFEESTLDRVVFRNCDLRGARLLRTPLRTVDLRGSRLDGIGLSPDQLAGAIITPEQADVFALAIGVKVRPPDGTDA